jgi:flavodoxin
MGTAVVYYSYSNNTRRIAEIVADKLNADLLELVPTVPYTYNYDELVKDEEGNMDKKELIELEPFDLDLDYYDRIILGTPVWWYGISPAMRTFLTDNKEQLKDKKFYAFITNGGWIGHAVNDLKELVDLKGYVDLQFVNKQLRLNYDKDLDKFIEDLSKSE